MNNDTDLISIRICKKIKNLLENESQQNGISLNRLINQVLTNYAQFDMLYQKIDIMSIPKAVYKAILDKMNVEELKLISRTEGIRALKSYAFIANNALTMEAFLECLKFWFMSNKIYFHYLKTDREYRLTIQHNLGKNFAVLLYTEISAIGEEIGYKTHIVYLAEDNITLIIKEI